MVERPIETLQHGLPFVGRLVGRGGQGAGVTTPPRGRGPFRSPPAGPGSADAIEGERALAWPETRKCSEVLAEWDV